MLRGRSRTSLSITITAAVLAGAVAVGVMTQAVLAENPPNCPRRYVAGGDELVAARDAEQPEQYSDTVKYSEYLVEKLQEYDEWCVYNTAPEDSVTSDEYRHRVESGYDFADEDYTQQGFAWVADPRLITLTIGRQNNTIWDHVAKCMDLIEDHDFLEANVCALLILSLPSHWTTLHNELSETLQDFYTQQAGNPNLVVAVTGYPNPYPKATDVATKIPGFCAQLVDTIPTCIARWVLLPPALVTLDEVVKKLNTTIEEVVQEYNQSTQGRFVFVNPYEKFLDHCMTMKVTIKTKVYHPTNQVDQHDTQETNFGCSDNWIAKRDNDTGPDKSPFFYLTPAINGVLTYAEQTTKEMGLNPNDKGHQCIADLIWEAIQPPLEIPEINPDSSQPCQGG